jgi:hypothetical protein
MMNLPRKLRYWLIKPNFWLWKKMSLLHSHINAGLYQHGNGHSHPEAEQFTVTELADLGPVTHRIQQLILLRHYQGGRKTLIVEVTIREDR